ncbi:MAG TPA: LysM peptidoglycan-binding domain-containing protein, partial [Ilumatobacter sp.]|nr:LysM peptidoglycan-binding domain-containing protein [Ilumatobacter sp.]
MMRVIAFIRSLLIVVVVGVVVPVALAVAGEWRFGGASPLHGVPAPDRWSADALRALLAEPLTDRMLADVAVRTAFVVGWLAVLVFVLTVVAETAHLVRHGGHHLPDVRGLQWSQRGARVIAAGLVALLPVLTQASAVIAAPGGSDPSLLGRPAPVLPVAAPADSLAPRPTPTQSTHVTAVAGDYVVRAGDSVFGIARQLAGPDDHAVAVYADHILDLNLGREMSAGQRFTNPGLIDVGWVLQLPAVDAEAGGVTTPSATSHTVLPGESLWSIADDELGDSRLWPELFDANSGRTFDDGRTLVDPALLRPGWDLVVPGPSVDDDDSHHVDAEAPLAIDRQEPTAPVSTPAVVDHDAHHVDAAPAGETITVPRTENVAPALLDHNDGAAGPENVWAAAPGTSDDIAGVDGAAAATQAVAIDDSSPQLLTIRRAAMLVGGVLTLVAVRRRRRLREAPPRARLPQAVQRAESLEHELRNVTAGEGVARVDLAIRAATVPLVEGGRRLLAAFAGGDGTIEIVSSGPVVLPAMWRGAGDRWTLPPSVALETIAADARRVNAPCPALVQLGVDDSGRDVYVDLEAISALEIGGSDAARGAIVAAIAATLAG